MRSWHFRLFGALGVLLSSNVFAVKLETVVPSGLVQPVFVTVAPDDPAKLYIVEQRGVIKAFDNGKLQQPAFLDIHTKVVSGGELGLLSIAFHPKFATNRRFFINYTTQKPKLATVVSELTVGSLVEKEIFRIEQPFRNHNGGQLQFGPDGYLYIGMGDGGDAGDPDNRAQNLNDLLGKMLRVDVDHGAPYAIPASNPFAQGGGRAEIFAWGLRNPWRFSFDRANGRLIAGDVGQYTLEEIDVIENGKNYGWRQMEASKCFNPAQGCKTAGMALPIYEYGRNEGGSITGGYVYRGKQIPSLVGHYIYADYITGRIWALKINEASGKAEGNQLILQTELAISSFGEDSDGEIFVVNHGGAILRLAP